MINTNMSLYDFYTFGDSDGYGQPQLSTDVKGTIKMSINITSQSIQDNINYLNANYVGLTYDNNVNDTYVIQYGDTKLKVLYINNKGRLNQVFMSKYD